MKLNIIKSRLLAAVICLAGAAQAQAYDFMSGGIAYSILSMADMTCQVVRKDKYQGYSGDIVIPETVNYLGRTFTVTSIGGNAFTYYDTLWDQDHGSNTLFSVKCPDTVTSIGDGAFKGSSNLVEVECNSVTEIGKNAFSDCSSLTDVHIRNAITSIGSYAFDGCSSLKSVFTLDATSIGSYAFYGCSSLEDVTISNSVTSIGINAFHGCTGLTEVSIPNSVTEIAGWAFENCSGLTEVTIPNSVTRINEYTFSGCSSLTEVTIPNSVTSIGDFTFSGCSSLTEVTIPNSVTWIGNHAFEGCENITTIYSLNPTPPSFPFSFGFESSVYENATLYVPEGSLETYKSASIWGNFANIQEFDPTGISGVEAAGGVEVSVEGGSIVVSGAQDNVAVYSLSGAMVGRAKGGSRAVVAVPSPGVYVVKAGGKAVKVRINNE